MGIALSKRQEQFISCVFEGLNAQDIAEKYNVKIGTVKNILTMAYERLGINNDGKLRGTALRLIGQAVKQNAIQLWIDEN